MMNVCVCEGIGIVYGEIKHLEERTIFFLYLHKPIHFFSKKKVKRFAQKSVKTFPVIGWLK